MSSYNILFCKEDRNNLDADSVLQQDIIMDCFKPTDICQDTCDWRFMEAQNQQSSIQSL